MSSIVIFYDRVGFTAALQTKTGLLAITARKDFGDLLVTFSLSFQLILISNHIPSFILAIKKCLVRYLFCAIQSMLYCFPL